MDVESQLRQLARTFGAKSEMKEIFKSNPPYIICGVTAAGKNVLERYLISHGPFEKLVTHTNRQPRIDEIDGKDYWFVSSEQMLDMAQNGKFIEMQFIHGYIYGVSRQAATKVATSGKHPTLNIDVQGAINITKLMKGVNPILLIPPSYAVWMTRLGSRSKISDGERGRRMHSARDELEKVLSNRSFVVVVNEEVSRTGEAIIKGLPTSQSSQARARELAQELFDYVRNE